METIKNELNSIKEPIRKDIHTAVKKVLRLTKSETIDSRSKLSDWLRLSNIENTDRYSSHLMSQSVHQAANIHTVSAVYNDQKPVDGRELLRENFDAILAKYPEVMIFGEDSGKIGGVNQGLEGLQIKYGEHRVFDTGIREATIMGRQLVWQCVV